MQPMLDMPRLCGFNCLEDKFFLALEPGSAALNDAESGNKFPLPS